jgi:hypothetical protein
MSTVSTSARAGSPSRDAMRAMFGPSFIVRQ